MSGRIGKGLALAAVVSLALISCQGEIQPPDYLVLAIESAPTNLDPRLATDAASVRIGQLIYNGLLKYDDRSNLVSDLAERFERLSDTEYRVSLKRRVKFHNGRELTAADVKYTYESILDPNLASPNYSSFSALKEIVVVDRYTLRFVLAQPYSPFLSSLAVGIVPEEVARDPRRSLSAGPVGTGPFRFLKGFLAEGLTLVAHQDYFGGRPKLNGIVVKVVPDDTVRVLELLRGQVDLVVNAVPPDALPLLRGHNGINLYQRPGISYSYLGMNLTDPILRDRRVREAIAMAIDREGIVTHLLKGTATPARGLLFPENWAYEPKLKEYPYDPEAAARMLDAAGYPDPPGPEPRFRLSYKTSQNDLRRTIGEAIMDQLARVGIRVTMRSYEWGTFFNDIKSGNFQLFSLTWVGIREPDLLYYIFHSDSLPPRGANRVRYVNPEVDRLLAEARTLPDQNSRRERYRRAQQLIAGDLPYVSLWYTSNIAAARKRVRGVNLNSAGDFTFLKEVWLGGEAG